MPAMIDSSATALFIHKDFCKCKNILTVPLKKEIALYNIDGTRNTTGSITHVAKLKLTVCCGTTGVSPIFPLFLAIFPRNYEPGHASKSQALD